MFDTAIWAAITPKITMASFGAIAPAVVLVVTALLLMLFVSFKVDREIQVFTTFLGIGLAAFLLWSVGLHRFPEVDVQFAAQQAISYVEVDAFAMFFHMIFLAVAAVTCLLSVRYLALYHRQPGEFFALVLFATVGMMVMTAARDLLVMYLALETMSLTTYVLVGSLGPQRASQEGALKYFLVGAMGSAIFLFGMAFLYGATGSLHFDVIGNQAATAILGTSRATAGYFTLGATFLLVGFAFKVAAVPFHMWTPDAYDGAPTPVTMMMAISVKAAAFAVFARVVVVSLDLGGKNWVGLVLLVISAATMIWGNFAAIAQRNIKRMLAYSSVAHAGYMLMAIVAREELSLATSALRFYFFVYMITTIGAFTVVLIFEKKDRRALLLSDYAGMAKKYPVASAALSLFLLSLAGIPPTAGFLGKWFIFSAAIKTGYIVLAVVGVLASLVSVYYYTRVIYTMYMMPESEDSAISEDLTPYPYEQRLMIALAALVLLVGIFPDSIAGLTQRGVLEPVARKGLAALKLQKQHLAAQKKEKREAARKAQQRRRARHQRARQYRQRRHMRRAPRVVRKAPIRRVIRQAPPRRVVVRQVPPRPLPVKRAVVPVRRPVAPVLHRIVPPTVVRRAVPRDVIRRVAPPLRITLPTTKPVKPSPRPLPVVKPTSRRPASPASRPVAPTSRAVAPASRPTSVPSPR
ncbi:MAG: NADH-quinone oxidoreductase subunit NuoN [Myxococcales bacterium]|nr:NADH-quinone oxidoreductase subunit NuoN [Myxococcales bacterium]